MSQNQLYGVVPENICSLEDSVISQVLASGNYFCPPYPFCIEDSLIQESEYCDNGIECVADDGTDGNILWGSCYSIENTTVINLAGNNGNDLGDLYGPIPPEIGQFLNLDTLNLSLNKKTLLLKIDKKSEININKPPNGRADGRNIIPKLKNISPLSTK